MPSIAQSRGQQRRLEWALLSAALLALVAWLSSPGQLNGVNHLVQDASLRLGSRPAHPDIVIVTIDDHSIANVGRWPWRRALHAELITRIATGQPKAIGLDVLFNEEDLDYPQDDLLLASAIARSGNIVLPVFRRGYGPQTNTAELPWHLFSNTAAQLGHVHVAPDDDGVVRSLYLNEGPAPTPWPHFSTALQCTAKALPCPPTPARRPSDGGTPWTTTDRTLIAFAGGPSHFNTYSYIDVLHGRVPSEAFHNKYVLVGAAASGLGDMFATPMSQQSRLMPGVEIVAHVLDAQLSGIEIRPASQWLNTVFNLVPVALALVALLLLGPFAAMAISAGLGLVTLLICLLLSSTLGLSFGPAAALLGLSLAYPLWSWRRLSAAAHFLQLEMDRLQQDGLSMRQRKRRGDSSDVLERRINAVERATRQLRDLHHFVSESLQQLPAPTLVCDPQGIILLSNTAASRHVGQAPDASLQGLSVVDLLHDLVLTGTQQPLLTNEQLQARTLPAQSEGLDSQGRSLLVQCKPFTDQAQAGWLLTLVDLTEIRRARYQRDQAINFISHDIRAPNASILTLLEMQQAYPNRLPHNELMQRIGHYARNSLDMAESFVRLASAESQEYRMVPLDLADMLSASTDDLWALARDKDMHIVIDDASEESAPTVGDRSMLSRALTNVLSNAVKYSPAHSEVRCRIIRQADHWVVSVRDQGPGIAPAQQDRLFAPFQRLHDRSHPTVGGIGLGLAFVYTVVQRHGGAVKVVSDLGKGADFQLSLPATALEHTSKSLGEIVDVQ